MINSRTKGKAGEREAINKILQPIVKSVYEELCITDVPRLARNLQQSDNGGYDIIGLTGYAFEIKRAKNLAINNWWDQTVVQAGKDELPVLLYRQDHKKWRAVIWTYAHVIGQTFERVRSDISIEDFSMWLRSHLYTKLLSRH